MVGLKGFGSALGRLRARLRGLNGGCHPPFDAHATGDRPADHCADHCPDPILIELQKALQMAVVLDWARWVGSLVGNPRFFGR